MPPDAQILAQARVLAKVLQEATGNTIEMAFGDDGYIGHATEEAATGAGIGL